MMPSFFFTKQAESHGSVLIAQDLTALHADNDTLRPWDVLTLFAIFFIHDI